ncbi:hypothetical protein [Clostridium perfringens]|uniref:hypothetical protein n=1 Tax=Clostridium perfringens TaxID=1502 RepID=UPI0024BCF494|nr:hypothetical protein [Clostridium perfringens]
MMKIIESIKNEIISSPKDMILIKRLDVFIPYSKIIINCLIENSRNLSILFETILNLILLEINTVKSLSNILGLDENIINATIRDMINSEFIVNNIVLQLTSKGEKAIQTRNFVEYTNLNISFAINLITGDILDIDSISENKINKHNIFLKKEITINKEFLNSNFKSINYLYKRIQEEELENISKDEMKEIYKINKIISEKTIYINHELSIFKSIENNDLKFSLKNDKNNILKESFIKQLKRSYLDYSPELSPNYESDNFYIKRNLLLKTLNLNNSFSKNEKANYLINFFGERCLINSYEYEKYFEFYNDYFFEEILIETNKVNKLLTLKILNNLKKICKTKKVKILYDKDEFNAVEKLRKFLGSNTDNLLIKEKKDIKNTIFIFKPNIKILIYENKINFLDRDLLYVTGIINLKLADKLLINKIIK